MSVGLGMEQLSDIPDWHTVLTNESIAGRTGVPGELNDYLILSGQRDDPSPIEAFNLFIKRWVHPRWHPHLMDSDENEAEMVRQWIRRGMLDAWSHRITQDNINKIRSEAEESWG